MVTEVALLIGLASTLFMTGLIWFVQVVHYPLFGRVEIEAFGRYHAEHCRRTAAVVLPPMALEWASAAALVVRPPEGVGPWLAWVGLAVASTSWLVTVFWFAPAHERLARGFDPGVHRALVRANWLRVATWTAHAMILLVMAARTFH